MARRSSSTATSRLVCCLSWISALQVGACQKPLEGAPGVEPEAASDAAGPEYAERLRALRPLLARDMTTLVRPPFVVISNESRAQLAERAEWLVELAARLLERDFFARRPEPIEVWMFRDAQSYRHYTRRLTGREPSTPFGFYLPRTRAIYVNIATGGGTLIHEMVHPYMEANFPECPPWYDEGLGSLFEGSEMRDGRLVGLLNWRLPGLRQAIETSTLEPLTRIVASDDAHFYGDETGNYYAASRYLLYYLQENGLLRPFHHALLEDQARDPTGQRTLERMLGQGLERFEPHFRKWVLELRPFRKHVSFEDAEVGRLRELKGSEP